MTARPSLFLVLALFLPATSVSAQDVYGNETDDYVSRQAALGDQALGEFEALALECHSARQYADSDQMHILVLAVDPDNRASRRALRYRRDRKLGWLQGPGWRPRKNRSSDPSLELAERVKRAMTDYRNSSLALIKERQVELRRSGVEQELAKLLMVLPDDPTLRSARGEVLFQGQWVLGESATALRHRNAFPQLAQACLSLSPEPTAGALRPEESDMHVPWNAIRQTPSVRVVGTTGLDEARATSRTSHAVGDYFRTVFAVDNQHREDFTIYLMGFEFKQAFLSQWPGLKAQTLRGLQQADGGWLDSPKRLAEWSSNPARRIDGAARQTLGTLFIDTYGITGRHGWAWEGIGLYMVHGLLGTRLTWFFDSEGYAPPSTTGLWTSLQASGLDWSQAARSLLARKNAPYIHLLLGRRVNAMSEEDVLISYVLASYLIEGFPQETPRILRRIGRAEHPRRVFESELGYSLGYLEQRLLRWLNETALPDKRAR